MNVQPILDRIQQLQKEMLALEIDVRSILENPAQEPDNVQALLQSILEKASLTFRIADASILSDNRNMLLVSARSAFVRTGKLNNISYLAMALFLNKDHSSLIYLDQKFEERKAKIPEHAGLMDALINQFIPKA